jgi:DEP domain-containing protein 5
MWRLLKSKVGECLYTEQEISFIGGSGASAGGGAGGPANPNPTPLKTITAKIRAIYIGGEKVSVSSNQWPSSYGPQVSSGYMTTGTKAIFRSSSAKITIFIQICREFWEFAGDGERYYEKIVHSFLPALFTKWKDAGTNHIVSIVLISRVHYEQAEIDYAAGPLRRDEDGTWYKDFFKVITDLEVIRNWKPTLVSLKNSFWDFQRDILLNHHYHQTSHDTASDPPEEVRLVGRISFAHDGPILEAVNLALNPTETHYIDRSLSLTGSSTILITPGTGYFRVSKHLLRLTTSRLLDSGFGLDLVSLAKPPLHQTPIFSFRGMEPALKVVPELPSARDMDPLWGGDDDPKEAAGREKVLFWWEPFWMCVSFWDQQLDLPFREDRYFVPLRRMWFISEPYLCSFVARAKMHDIQMLGLLEQDVLSTVEIPFLPPRVEYAFAGSREAADGRPISKRAADQFDNDVFALQRPSKSTATARNSMISSGSGTIMASSYSSTTDRRSSMSRHNSHFIAKSTRIAPIEESPRPITKDLPSEEAVTSKPRVATMFRQRSTSLSKASIRSTQSHQSTLTVASVDSQQPPPSTRSSLASKLTPSWLLNPFRSAPSEVQAASVSATGSNNATPSATPDITPKLSSIRLPNVTPAPAISSSPAPVTISMNSSGRSALAGFWGLDERDHYFNPSPMNTPPLEEPTSYARSNMSSAHAFSIPLASTSPGSPSNPCKPRAYLSREQASLSHRWQHLYPQMHYKHQIKWKSIVTPGCLPLTVEYFPTTGEIESSYVVTSYDFVIDPPVRSFLIKPPAPQGTKEEVRRQWALVVMRAMVAVRLAQGFQFVLRPQGSVRGSREDRDSNRRIKAFELGDDTTPKPTGAAEVLATDPHPVYLSMSNEIHRISYTGDAIQVRRYVRRMPPSQPIQYQCLIWPKLGGGYTELETTFASHGLENYGWNRWVSARLSLFTE